MGSGGGPGGGGGGLRCLRAPLTRGGTGPEAGMGEPRGCGKAGPLGDTNGLLFLFFCVAGPKGPHLRMVREFLSPPFRGKGGPRHQQAPPAYRSRFALPPSAHLRLKGNSVCGGLFWIVLGLTNTALFRFLFSPPPFNTSWVQVVTS